MSRPLLLSLAAAVLVAGCGDDRSPRAAATAAAPFCQRAMERVDAYVDSARTASPAPDDPRFGGTAVVAGIAELVNGMNSLATIDYGASQYHQFVNLMTLVRLDGDLEPTPWLAESWSVSDDGTEITFRLRDDVYWHDGELTDARDVAFTFLRATDPETAFPNTSFWDHYVKGPDGVRVVDDFTVAFRLTPHAEFMDPWRAVGILPEHLLGEVPPTELASHPFGTVCPVGNGPFVFVSHRPRESWTFEANPAFPEGLGGRPFLERLVYRVIPDQTTLLTELLTGSVDVYVSVRPDQASAVVEDADADLRAFDPREFTFVGWNTRRPQLADSRVRRAITLATNRDAVVEVLLRGYGEVAESGVPPFHWAHDPDLEGPGFDPAAARRLLDEAGWRDRDADGVRESVDGVPLTISLVYNAGNQDRQTIAELMQAELRSVGIDLTPLPLEPGEVARRATDPTVRDFDGLVLAWVPEFKVDEKDLFHSDRADQPLAFSGLRDPQLDRLLDTLQLVVDREEARPLWHAYQRRISALQPFTYFYYSRRLTGVSTRLQDVEMDFRGEYMNVQDWWIQPARMP
ncbi:MAG TPA: ABC transporter substrate-binding protein [Longimicrobiales bacterium]|nr:ABC transporter substrate-binding protein [Longimicrobiales bacterium]